MKSYEYQSDFAKKFLAQGRDEGRREGRDEGRREGRSEGERVALLRVLRARFGELPAAAVEHVERADIAQVERWLDMASTAGSLASVLDQPS